MAEYIFEEMVDESLIDNTDVIRLIAVFKEALQNNPETVNRNYFIYHPDTKLVPLLFRCLIFLMKKVTIGEKNSANPPVIRKIYLNRVMKIL